MPSRLVVDQQGASRYAWRYVEARRDARTLALHEFLDARRDEFFALLAEYGATDPKLFGSVARGTAHVGSDIERNLQIIGEAANHLPAETTDAHPEVAWPQIRGFRDILVHQYFGVDVDVVREVVKTCLPPLAEALSRHVGRQGVGPAGRLGYAPGVSGQGSGQV